MSAVPTRQNPPGYALQTRALVRLSLYMLRAQPQTRGDQVTGTTIAYGDVVIGRRPLAGAASFFRGHGSPLRPLISGLVALGWLPEDERDDKGAVAHALTQLAERALWANVTPSAGSQGYVCFACDLQATTVDTLIRLRWLPAEYADDINEIARAFRGFAGRALDVARRGTLDLCNIRTR
jgi:hypothetical protein